MSLFHEAKTIILGNTSGPAEIRWTRGAEPKKVAKLKVCTEYGGGPNRESHKEWHTVILFGRLADQAEKFVTRPMLVYVEGRPQTRRWQNDQGQNVLVHEVIANVFRPVGYQKGDSRVNQQPNGAQAMGNAAANSSQSAAQAGVPAPAPGNFSGSGQPSGQGYGYDGDDFGEDPIPF